MGQAFFVSLILLPFLILIPFTWAREYRLHGRNLARAVGIAARVTWRSRASVFLFAATCLVVGALFVPQWLSLSASERIAALIVAATTITWVLRPPGIVVLASS